MAAASKTIIKMKAKRNAISARYKLSKSWTEVDAAMALKAEEVNAQKLQKDVILIIRFPDPEISREIVKCYSPDIESVHFQLNFAPRYCLVHLKPGTDVEKTIENLSKIPFGTGFLSVEIKQIPQKTHSTKLSEIDPYTLYVGNLPTTIACKTLKDRFPGAARIDIGFAQRMKYTRYAFIRYHTVQQAIEAYKRMLDAEIGGRSLTIRFRRLTSAGDGNKDGDGETIDEVQDDILSQSTVASEDNSTNLNPITEPSESLEQNSSIEDVVKHKENENYKNNLSNETCHGSNDLNETNENHPLDGCTDEVPVSHTVSSESTSAENPSGILLNIKSDPDVDPDDIVRGNEEIITRFDNNENTVKQEKELATDFEFFAPVRSQNNVNTANKDKSTVQDTVSINSMNDETDTMSVMSSISLGEFLQTCQRPQEESDDIDDVIGPPLKKKNRQDNDDSIKAEPLEELNATTRENDSQVLLNKTIKTEVSENNENALVADNAENFGRSRNTNKTVKKIKACHLTQASPSNNTDDMVPSNALFLRDNKHNSLETGYNMCDNDEFFETRTKSNTQTQSQSQVVKGIKTEPFCRRTHAKQSKSISNNQQSVSSNRNTIMHSRRNTSRIHSTNSLESVSSTTLAVEDNDLVPEQNLLSSRLITQTESLSKSNQNSLDIKQELENVDLFSTPSQTNLRNDTTNSLSEDSDLSDLWSTNLLRRKTTETSRSETLMDSNDDNDIILVSDNTSRKPKNLNPKLPPVKNHTFFFNQTDLLIFTPKTTAATTISLESSKLLSQHRHNNLDKLFAQLDSESDSEL